MEWIRRLTSLWVRSLHPVSTWDQTCKKKWLRAVAMGGAYRVCVWDHRLWDLRKRKMSGSIDKLLNTWKTCHGCYLYAVLLKTKPLHVSDQIKACSITERNNSGHLNRFGRAIWSERQARCLKNMPWLVSSKLMHITTIDARFVSGNIKRCSVLTWLELLRCVNENRTRSLLIATHGPSLSAVNESTLLQLHTGPLTDWCYGGNYLCSVKAISRFRATAVCWQKRRWWWCRQRGAGGEEGGACGEVAVLSHHREPCWASTSATRLQVADPSCRLDRT